VQRHGLDLGAGAGVGAAGREPHDLDGDHRDQRFNNRTFLPGLDPVGNGVDHYEAPGTNQTIVKATPSDAVRLRYDAPETSMLDTRFAGGFEENNGVDAAKRRLS